MWVATELDTTCKWLSMEIWTKTYNLNSNFKFDFGSYTKGTALFNIPELEPGNHQLRIRAWDIFNNSSTTDMNFTVVKGLEPTILNIDCSENPAKNHTTFIVNHTYSGNNMNVSIELFDSNGQLLWTHSQNNVSTNGSYMVPWDLTSNKGFALKNRRLSLSSSPQLWWCNKGVKG